MTSLTNGEESAPQVAAKLFVDGDLDVIVGNLLVGLECGEQLAVVSGAQDANELDLVRSHFALTGLQTHTQKKKRKNSSLLYSCIFFQYSLLTS